MMEKTKLSSLYISFFKIGIMTFGGGLAMLPMFEKEICDKHKWSNQEEILDYYSISQITPGVIATNVATFIGNKERGVIGGIVATLGIVTPSILIICLIATCFSSINTIPLVQKLLKGLASGVCALIIPSLIKFYKTSIINFFSLVLYLVCIFLIVFTNVPKILIILVVIIMSIILGLRGSRK